MGTKNYKIVRNFLTDENVSKIIDWVESIRYEEGTPNHHLSEISKDLNGVSCIFDISDNEITNYITTFQSVSKVSKSKVPDFILVLFDEIAKLNNISKENIFIQAVDMGKGGKITPHYDAAMDGYINYKCNISVLSEDYKIFIGDQDETIKQKDLYCFEASLFKHWTNEFNSRRVFLSFGFVVPYKELNRDENDPRIRLSKRITKRFQ